MSQTPHSRKFFRIFDPDTPSHPSRPILGGMNPTKQTTQQSEPLNRSECMLDLHQQAIDAIHKVTALIANSLEITPGDHTC